MEVEAELEAAPEVGEEVEVEAAPEVGEVVEAVADAAGPLTPGALDAVEADAAGPLVPCAFDAALTPRALDGGDAG